ncbi:MAG: hypothetical protein IKK93_11975 [Campylobacter sp.]|nr:hypothetical protein [Campylobacter sp.]
MTKELEKEAIKRVDAFIDSFSQDIRSTLYDRLNQEDVKDFLYSLYIDSAEPREKKIAKLQESLLDVSEKATKRIAELEKENEMFKKANEIIAQQRDGRDADISILENQIEVLEEENKKLKSEKGCETCTKFDEVKLTKAKEHIQNILGLLPEEVLHHDYYRRTYVEPAERFLREEDSKEGCPDILCEDCTKEDCSVRKLGLVPNKEL